MLRVPPPPHYCDPTTKPKQMCPGNIPCPDCGSTNCKCPTHGPGPSPPPTPGPPPPPTPKPPNSKTRCRLALLCKNTDPCQISVGELFPAPSDRMQVLPGMEVMLQDAVLKDGTVSGDNGGGLLYVWPGGIVTATRVKFINGTNLHSSGGAVCLYSNVTTGRYSKFTCTDCDFRNNRASMGGAVYAEGNLTLVRPKFFGNSENWEKVNGPQKCKDSKTKQPLNLCPCEGQCGSACYCRKFSDPANPKKGGGYSCNGCGSGLNCKRDLTNFCPLGLDCSYCNDQVSKNS
eukprot:SAG31_NODE_3701_length_3974_cov_21.160516_2_plen_288_part_00